MAAIRRILAAADSTEPAVTTAAAIARRLGASLRLAGGVYEPATAGERDAGGGKPAPAQAALISARARELEELAGVLRAGGGLDVSAARSAADALLEAAGEFAADLLVTGMGVQRHFGQAEWRMVREAPCPVLFTQGAPEAGYRNVLVPVDPMHAHDKPAALDEALISAAKALADPAAGRVHLLHCYLPSEYLPLRAPGVPVRGVLHPEKSPLSAHRDALQQLALRHGIAADRVRLEPGDARQGIPDAAAGLGADLVVMGAVARSRLKRLLIGSTAEAVLDRLNCDVLAVRPAGI